MVYFFLRSLAVILSKIIFRIEVYGKENLPKKGGFILASNHASFLDPIVLGVASFRKLNYMARKSLFKNKFFGWVLTKLGVFPLIRNSADFGAIKEGIRRLQAGRALVLFPEGTRSEDGLIRKPLSGVGFLAQKAHVPIVPTYVFGTNRALPRGARFIRPAKVKVYFGRPIFTEGRQSYEETAIFVMQQIKHLHATKT